MRSILKFIETVYLGNMSLGAQVVWIRSFYHVVKAKREEIQSRYELEQIQKRIDDGKIDVTECGITVEEVASAVKHLRRKNDF